MDVDGVLITGRPSDGDHWGDRLEADLGLSFTVLQDAFFVRHWEDVVTGRAELRDRLVPVLAEIAPALTVQQLLTYWFEQDAQLDRRLLDEIAALRRGGLPVYLATNQEHERARYLMTTLGLAAQVDGCYYSAALGHKKPAPTFFAAVALKVGLAAGELLPIDDAAENVRAALDAGWHAVQWTGSERLSELITKASTGHHPRRPVVDSHL
jgi:putative hydrolase of the HAD superfamily